MKIIAYTKDQQPHEVADIIASGNAVYPESYYLIGIYIGTFGGPTFAVQADNEQEAIEELAASKYGHFILIDNEKDLAEYEDLDVVHYTDAGPCYIQEPIAYMAKVDHWDEFTARQIALENLPDRIMVNIEVNEEFDIVTISPDDERDRKWIAATNLHDHSSEIVLVGQDRIREFVEIYDRSCSEEGDEGFISIWGGYYSIDTYTYRYLVYRYLVGGQSD